MKIRFASRQAGFEDFDDEAVNGAALGSPISSRCEITVLILDWGVGEQPYVLAGADLIWFPSELSNLLRTRIAKHAGTSRSRVCITSTHTHGTPNPERQFQYGERCIEFARYVEDVVWDCYLATAKSPSQEASVRWSSRIVEGLAINRRRSAIAARPLPSRRMQNLPNAGGLRDDRLDALILRDAKSEAVLAIVCRFTCHPVADPGSARGADFFGYSREKIRKKIGATIPVLSLQGFAGDIRPRLIQDNRTIRDMAVSSLVGDRFRTSRDGDAERMGTALAEALFGIVHSNDGTPLKITAAVEHYNVPLSLDDGSTAPRPLDITVWHWNPITLLFASAEMLSGHLPVHRDSVACIGYANGMVGYVPTREDLKFGGYEVDASRKRFGLPDRLAPSTCEDIRRLIADCAGAGSHPLRQDLRQ